MQGILKEKIEIFYDLLSHEFLKNKASEITSVIIKNATDPVANQSEVWDNFIFLLSVG